MSLLTLNNLDRSAPSFLTTTVYQEIEKHLEIAETGSSYSTIRGSRQIYPQDRGYCCKNTKRQKKLLLQKEEIFLQQINVGVATGSVFYLS